MNFDIISMKQRAKELLNTTKPNVMISSTIYALFTIAYILGSILLFGFRVKLWYVYFIIMGLIHIIFRSGFKLFSLNVAREEKTKISDIFLSFKEKPLNMLLSGIVRDICYAVRP